MVKLPRETLGDHVDAAARAAATAGVGAIGQQLGMPVGVIEAAVAVVFGCIAVPLQGRRDRWFQHAADALTDLQRRVGALEENPRKEAVVDTVLAAIPIALRTSSETKRLALRNAIVNAGLPGAPDTIRQQMFLRLLEELTDMHVHVLALLASPEEWFRQRGRELPRHRGGTGINFVAEVSEARLEAVLATAFPEYASEEALLALVLDDLNARGLVEAIEQRQRRRVGPLTMCVPGCCFTTSLGHAFSRFIGAPPAS